MAVNSPANSLPQWTNNSQIVKFLRMVMKLFYRSGIIRFIRWGSFFFVHNLRDIKFLKERSVVLAAVVYWINFAALLKGRFISRSWPGWRKAFEAAVLIIAVFMPVLNSWGLLLPLLILLWLGGETKTNPAAEELTIFWLVLVLSALFATGLKSGLANLIIYSGWILIAYLSAKTFSARFSKKLLKYLVYSSPLWLSIGLLQQWAGAPTPPGWLGYEQSRLIMIRSYSLFGNPNIYALYLLSMLVLASHFLTESAFDRERLGRPALKYSRITKWLPVLILIMILGSLYFTYSRFAWLLGLGFLLFWFWPRLGKRRLPVLIAAPLFLLALEGFKIRMAPLVNLTDSSFRYRLQIWRGVAKALANFWLWGAGPGGFQRIYPWYQLNNTVSAHAHQLFLQIWLENGLLSLIAFLWLLGKIICRFLANYESAKALTKAIAAVIIIFSFYGLTEAWFQSRLAGGYFWLFFGILIASEREELVAE